MPACAGTYLMDTCASGAVALQQCSALLNDAPMCTVDDDLRTRTNTTVLAITGYFASQVAKDISVLAQVGRGVVDNDYT